MKKSKNHKHIQSKYDKLVSKTYNEAHSRFDVQSEARVQLLKQFKDYEAQIGQPKNILDLATGTGELLHDLSNRYPEAKIWGLDLSEKMIEKARELNQNNPKIKFITDNALHIDQHFKQELDLLIMQFLLSYVDSHQLFSKLNPLINPGGFISITSTTLESYPEILEKSKKLYKKIFFKDIDDKMISSVSYIPKSHKHLCSILEDHGFKIINDQLLKKKIVFNSYDEFRYFAVDRGWFLQAFDHINPISNFIIKMISKKIFPFSTHVNASIILAQKI